jgi:hypothetical protein
MFQEGRGVAFVSMPDWTLLQESQLYFLQKSDKSFDLHGHPVSVDLLFDYLTRMHILYLTSIRACNEGHKVNLRLWPLISKSVVPVSVGILFSQI